MKRLVNIVKVIGISLIPTLLQYIGTSNLLELLQKSQILGAAVDVLKLKTSIGLIGCILTAFILVYYQVLSDNKKEYLQKVNNQLLELQKKSFISLLSSEVSSTFSRINIRIFVPNYSLKYYLSGKKRLKFAIKNVTELADSGITDNLQFTVLPKDDAEGLVGDCYNYRKMIYDDNLEETNEKRYGLSEYQKNKTRTLKFSMVCPLFNELKDVIAIVAFDSEEKITMPDKNTEEYHNFIHLVLTYSQTLYEIVPDLFQPRRGIK